MIKIQQDNPGKEAGGWSAFRRSPYTGAVVREEISTTTTISSKRDGLVGGKKMKRNEKQKNDVFYIYRGSTPDGFVVFEKKRNIFILLHGQARGVARNERGRTATGLLHTDGGPDAEFRSGPVCRRTPPPPPLRKRLRAT